MNNKAEIGMLLSRIVVGLVFLVHGLMKYQGGIENTIGFFQKFGIPGFLAYPVGALEIVGGICAIIGLGTRFFAAIFSIIMLVVIIVVKASKGFMGFEFELALLAMSIHMVLAGSKFMALDQVFSSKAAPSASAS